jgi:predicted ArsR family transcriptional regulator
MSDNILALLYPVVKDFPEAPISVALLSRGLSIDERQLHDQFQSWHKDGLLEKKYQTVEVYKLTEKGIAAVRDAHASAME